MAERRLQEEKPFPRDPETLVIRGAEAFDLGDPKARRALLCLHGWTSTPREVRFVAERAAAAGFRCVGPRLKGHGLTVRALQDVTFKDHLEEVEEAFGRLAVVHESVHVLGLSMGGLLGLYLAARRRVAGLVLVAPFLRPAGTTFGLPNHLLVGRVPLKDLVGKDVRGPIDDPEGLVGHIAYHAMPAKAMVALVQATRDFRGLERNVTCPTLILHSVHDRTSDFSGSQDLIRDLGAADKTLVAFNRGNHVITLDYDRDRVERLAVDWLASRTGQSQSAS